MLKISLTHDVDRIKKTYQVGTHFLRALMKADFKRCLYEINSIKHLNEVYWNFNDIIEIENYYNIKSTFFFLIESIPFNIFKIKNWKLSLGRYDINHPNIVNIIKYLDSNGWEIGLHGSYLSYNNQQLLQFEKKKIEKILQHEIIGVRQHYINLSNQTWKIQKQCGFLYDSTWALKKGIGFRENRITPFRPYNDDFIVFPLCIMDSEYMADCKAKDKLYEIIEMCIENKAILVINWHTNNFNVKEFPGYRDAYCFIIETCFKVGCEFKTLSQYYSELTSH